MITTTTELSKYTLTKQLENKIVGAIQLKKELEDRESEIKQELMEAMDKYQVTSIKNPNFTISLVARANYKADGAIPTDFQKIVLDTSKVSTHDKLYGQPPKGITKSETKYIKWGSKKSDG